MSAKSDFRNKALGISISVLSILTTLPISIAFVYSALLGESSTQRTLYAIITGASLIISWTIINYYTICILFRCSYWLCRIRSSTNSPLLPRPPVAILLCVRDDWREHVGRACVRALGSFDQLFICDDSNDIASAENVRRFAENHLSSCTVLRRRSLEGYKAGNLNHCLDHIGQRFAFFLVVDHDNSIHPKTIDRGVQLLEVDNTIPFVQFAQRENASGTSSFAKRINGLTRAIWWIQPVHGMFGMPICFGHTALFRTKMVQSIGGFPNSLTEDLAITLKFAGSGQLGIYDTELIATEELPETYTRFRERYIRWSVGTVDCWLNRQIRPRAKRVGYFILLDGVLQAATLLYPVSFCASAAGWAIFHAIFVGRSEICDYIGYTTFGLSIALPAVSLMVVSRHRNDGLLDICYTAAVYCSLIIPVICNICISRFRPERVFVNTGNDRFDWLIVNHRGSATDSFIVLLEFIVATIGLWKLETLGIGGIIFTIGCATSIWHFAWEQKEFRGPPADVRQPF
jgi:cellulose synthase/poly-beta-1,6-N-acetylglucosamine synthase-like glycosyltransferase